MAPLIEATVLLAASKPSITSWVEVKSSASLLPSAHTTLLPSPHFQGLMCLSCEHASPLLLLILRFQCCAVIVTVNDAEFYSPSSL